jgi:hypothetical protein
MEVQDWAQLTSNAVTDQLIKVVNYIPNVLAAIVVILVGVIVAWAIKTVIVKGLGYIKLKRYTDSVGLDKVFTEKVEFANLIGDLARWTVIIVFLIPALEILGVSEVNSVLESILGYIPSVVLAMVAVLIGLVVADLVSRIIRSTAATMGTKNADLLADLAKWSIIVFVVLGALQQLNILPQLISTLTIGVMAFFVIAGGVSFGLGGKEAAAGLIAGIGKKFNK